MADQRFPRDIKGTYYATRQAYLTELARRHGYGSYAAYRAAPKPSSGTRTPTPRQRASERRARSAITLMRKEGLTVTQAAKRLRMTPSTIKRHEGGRLRQLGRRILATLFDRRSEPMRVLTPDGVIIEKVRDSRTRSRLGGYWDAVEHYLRTGDTSRLEPYRRRSFTTEKRGYRFIIDTDPLDRLGRAGELTFDDIYDNGWIS